MSRPSLVIFDMDDVLCHYNVGRRLRYLASIANTTARDVRAAVWDSAFEEEVDAGGYPDGETYLSEFAKRLGHPITKDQWLEARRIAMVPSDDVIALARALRDQAALAIFTNNGPLVKAHFDELLPPIQGLFNHRHCSYEFGTKKPDPEAYTRLTRHLAVDPADCWFIDDKKSNVEGARLAGLRAHHFRHFSLLETEARAQGFEI
jgi:glucose-1-phosphatase